MTPSAVAVFTGPRGPADALWVARRWLGTIRAAGDVDPPGVRRCPTCDTAIDSTRHANRRDCSLECRDRAAQRRVDERGHH